ncbi:hypothetical protein F4802DRAFT_554884 [Xylaria palmicola]|nr:hypothetical protein F4802DRAFT_554884 [Xylaria palmicola]
MSPDQASPKLPSRLVSLLQRTSRLIRRILYLVPAHGLRIREQPPKFSRMPSRPVMAKSLTVWSDISRQLRLASRRWLKMKAVGGLCLRLEAPRYQLRAAPVLDWARNFRGRMGSHNAEAYLASPEMVAAGGLNRRHLGHRGISTLSESLWRGLR